MKLLIYTLYALTVLLVSGFARAEGFEPKKSNVQISEVGLDQQTMDLHVAGYVPNPCYQNPTAVMVQDKTDSNVLVVRLVSPIPTQMCIQRIKDYTTVVNLRQLAQASELPLEDKAIYQLKAEGSDFAIEVLGQDLLN